MTTVKLSAGSDDARVAATASCGVIPTAGPVSAITSVERAKNSLIFLSPNTARAAGGPVFRECAGMLAMDGCTDPLALGIARSMNGLSRPPAPAGAWERPWTGVRRVIAASRSAATRGCPSRVRRGERARQRTRADFREPLRPLHEVDPHARMEPAGIRKPLVCLLSGEMLKGSTGNNALYRARWDAVNSSE